MSVPPSRQASRRRARPTAGALALLLAVAVGLAAFPLLRDDESDLADGLAGVEAGAQVQGDDLLVIDTVQGVGVFVDTSTGPVYVRYGDGIPDRFGVGTVVDVEGTVAVAVTGLARDEQASLDGRPYVIAEELRVDEE